MKKLIGLCVAAVIGVGAAQAALDAYDSVTVKTLTVPVTVNAEARTNAAVDISAAKGIANFIVMHTPAYTNSTTFTNTVALQKSTTGSSAWVAVTSVTYVANAATGTISSIKLDVNTLSRYLRVISTANDDASAPGAVIIYPK